MRIAQSQKILYLRFAKQDNIAENKTMVLTSHITSMDPSLSAAAAEL